MNAPKGPKAPVLIGVISDTHGFFDEGISELFCDVDWILHAGDVGDPQILERLSQVAPVVAVRGNVDEQGACASLPQSVQIVAAGFSLFMTHILDVPDQGQASDLPDPAPDIVIFGHSHRQCNECRDGILYLNPASAGRQRFSNPRSVSLLSVTPQHTVEARLLDL